MPLIVPNAMAALTGTTKNGRRSPRCLDNVGVRQYLVVEFDTGHLDEHAALLWHLAERAPMALVVFSGSKSLHGWFACRRATPQRLEQFFRYAVSFGADPATWTRCQPVRMPDGTREGTGKRQAVYYFNPEVVKS
jgi:hypothetical protein